MRDTGWRSVLTEKESEELWLVEVAQDDVRDKLRQLSSRKRSIMNRAIQRKKYLSHPKKGVDMDTATP